MQGILCCNGKWDYDFLMSNFLKHSFYFLKYLIHPQVLLRLLNFLPLNPSTPNMMEGRLSLSFKVLHLDPLMGP